MKKLLMTTFFLSVSLLAMSATKNYENEKIKQELASKGYSVTKETAEEYKIEKGKTQIRLKEYANENTATVAFSELLKKTYAEKDVIVPEKSNVRKGIFVFKNPKVKDEYLFYGNGIERPVVVNARGTEKDIREVLGILKDNRKPVKEVTKEAAPAVIVDPFQMRETASENS
ncbi:MAG: hypothetical protein ACRCXY_06245 [Fusobacteriaceae bacterium]